MKIKEFYVISTGSKAGIYETEWDLVKEYILKNDVKHKGFPTLQEAEEWWKENSKEPAIVYEIKVDPKTKKKTIVPKKEEDGLW